MPRWLFWVVLTICLSGLAGAVYVFGPKDVLFPGLLALFSFLVMWTTTDFHLWTKRNTTSSRQPCLILMEGTVSVRTDLSACELKISFSNPGDVPIFARSVKATLSRLVPNETLGKDLVVKHYCDPKMKDHPAKAIGARDFGRLECSVPIPNNMREGFWADVVPIPNEFGKPSDSVQKEERPNLQPERITLRISYISGSRYRQESFKSLKIGWDQERKSGSFRAEPWRWS